MGKVCRLFYVIEDSNIFIYVIEDSNMDNDDSTVNYEEVIENRDLHVPIRKQGRHALFNMSTEIFVYL
jgi:hypothetical protein